jgi:hypothetical protein
VRACPVVYACLEGQAGFEHEEEKPCTSRPPHNAQLHLIGGQQR